MLGGDIINSREKEVLQSQIDSEKAVLKDIEKQYKQALQDIDDKIAQLMGRNDADLQNVIYQTQYQKQLRTQVQSILEQLQANEFETVSEFLASCYTEGFVGTMYSMHGQGVPLIIPIDQKAVVKAVTLDSKLKEDLYTSLGVDITKLKKTVSGEITRGIAAGLTYQQIARSISNQTKAPLGRVKTIVQTESHRIRQAASYDAAVYAKSRGADVVKQWDSTLDGRTRDSHRRLDGQIRELDEPFEVDGKEAMYPGEFGDPAEDCNCRCVMNQRSKWNLGKEELNILKERAEFFGLDKSEELKEFEKKYLKAAENEAQFGFKYGANAVDVDFESLDTTEYKKKYDNISNNSVVNAAVYRVSMKILKHCDGTHHEDMYLINAKDGTVFAQVTDSVVDSGIIYSDEFKEKLTESIENNIPIIGIHNHPEGTPPSADDFRKAYENKYEFGIIPGHNGQLYRYETPDKPIDPKDADTMSADIAFFYSQGVDIDRASQTVYNGYGLKYTIIESVGDEE